MVLIEKKPGTFGKPVAFFVVSRFGKVVPLLNIKGSEQTLLHF
jgi:hypothetical protein